MPGSCGSRSTSTPTRPVLPPNASPRNGGRRCRRTWTSCARSTRRGNAATLSSAEWADPEIEFVVADGPEPGSWTGLPAMAEASRDFLGAWEDCRVEVGGVPRARRRARSRARRTQRAGQDERSWSSADAGEASEPVPRPRRQGHAGSSSTATATAPSPTSAWRSRRCRRRTWRSSRDAYDALQRGDDGQTRCLGTPDVEYRRLARRPRLGSPSRHRRDPDAVRDVGRGVSPTSGSRPPRRQRVKRRHESLAVWSRLVGHASGERAADADRAGARLHAFVTARRSASSSTPTAPKPSKPWGWRSRRCRRRTWSSCARSTTACDRRDFGRPSSCATPTSRRVAPDVPDRPGGYARPRGHRGGDVRLV